MRALLIHLPFLKGFRRFNLSISPSLGHMAAVLERHGHEVRILDLSVEKGRESVPSGCDGVGITSLPPNLEMFKEAIDILGDNCIGVIGGLYHRRDEGDDRDDH